MAKFQSPLLGYNNNVRHKNRQFHIQTEDSGVNHPHIITHLFMDGGRILKSVKKSYAEHVGADGMSEIVRGLMKEQHKAMFIALRDGQFDQLVDPTAAALAAATAAAPAPAVAAPEAAAAEVPAEPKSDPVVVEVGEVVEIDVPVELAPKTIDETTRPLIPSVPPPASAEQPKAAQASEEPAAPPSSRVAPARLPVPSAPPPPRVMLPERDPEDVPVTTRQPASARPDAIAASAAASPKPRPSKSPSGRELTLDFDALERVAHDAASPSLFHSSDLPPPPKNLFAAKEPGSGGIYRAVDEGPRHDPREESGGRSSDFREEPGSRPGVFREEPGSRPGVRREGAPPSTRQPHTTRISTRAPAVRPSEPARYAPARPAAIFGSSQRPPPASSLFSDELVSDKSLDEVILSYLAEDLEPPRRK